MSSLSLFHMDAFVELKTLLDIRAFAWSICLVVVFGTFPKQNKA